MQLVIVTFVCILVLVYGIYWVLVLRPEQQEQAALRKRLTATGSVVAVTGSVLEQPRQNLSQVRALNVVLQRSKGLSGPLETLVTQSGLKISVGTLLLACALVAVVTFFLVKLVTYYSLLAMSVAACTATIPYFLVRYARTRRLATFEEQFPDAIEMMARALRAGHAFPTGILMVAEEMPAPVGPEFKLLYDRQNFGMPVPDALKGFAERIPIIDARFFVTAVLTQRETGGNLSEVLDNLATVIRDRFKVKRQVRAVTAHGRITGWILSALPPSLAGILCIISPEYMKLLITDPLGMQMIGIGLFMQIVGTLIIRKLVNVPY
jgi:tight adherence protein B